MKGCSKSYAIWASFMGSFAILGGLQPPSPPPHSYAYDCGELLMLDVPVECNEVLWVELDSKPELIGAGV